MKSTKAFSAYRLLTTLIVILLTSSLPVLAQEAATPTPTRPAQPEEKQLAAPTVPIAAPLTLPSISLSVTIPSLVATPAPTVTVAISVQTTLSFSATQLVTGTQAVTGTQSLTTTASITATATVTATRPITAESPFDWATSENYLVLGADQRPDDPAWRTDTIIIVGLDRVHTRAAVFSIPRDTYVQIPGGNFGRINQLDHLGETRNGEGNGPLLVAEVLSDTFGVTIHHWVRMQMSGFVALVDAIGGVKIYLDCPFSEPILNLTTNRWEDFTLPVGENLLDGETAYWFVRLRLRESDLGRSSRQRLFLWALRDKIVTTNLIARFPELWTAFRGTFESDLSIFQILELGAFGMTLPPVNVRASSLGLAELEDFTTVEGARVLRIADPAHVRNKFWDVWDSPAMYQSYRHNPRTCAPLQDRAAILAIDGPPPATTAARPTPISTQEFTAPTPAPTPVVRAPGQTSRNADPALIVGRRIRIRSGFSLTLRTQPGQGAGRTLGSMVNGEQAVILGGPALETGAADTIVWWFIRTDNGVEGWAPANTETASLLEVWQ